MSAFIFEAKEEKKTLKRHLEETEDDAERSEKKIKSQLSPSSTKICFDLIKQHISYKSWYHFIEENLPLPLDLIQFCIELETNDRNAAEEKKKIEALELEEKQRRLDEEKAMIADEVKSYDNQTERTNEKILFDYRGVGTVLVKFTTLPPDLINIICGYSGQVEHKEEKWVEGSKVVNILSRTIFEPHDALLPYGIRTNATYGTRLIGTSHLYMRYSPSQSLTLNTPSESWLSYDPASIRAFIKIFDNDTPREKIEVTLTETGYGLSAHGLLSIEPDKMTFDGTVGPFDSDPDHPSRLKCILHGHFEDAKSIKTMTYGYMEGLADQELKVDKAYYGAAIGSSTAISTQFPFQYKGYCITEDHVVLSYCMNHHGILAQRDMRSVATGDILLQPGSRITYAVRDEVIVNDEVLATFETYTLNLKDNAFILTDAEGKVCDPLNINCLLFTTLRRVHLAFKDLSPRGKRCLLKTFSPNPIVDGLRCDDLHYFGLFDTCLEVGIDVKPYIEMLGQLRTFALSTRPTFNTLQ